jgi:hypothetical protein
MKPEHEKILERLKEFRNRIPDQEAEKLLSDVIEISKTEPLEVPSWFDGGDRESLWGHVYDIANKVDDAYMTIDSAIDFMEHFEEIKKEREERIAQRQKSKEEHDYAEYLKLKEKFEKKEITDEQA